MHLVNNRETPVNNEDKLYKVRSIFDFITERCNNLTMEDNLCVDEQMIPLIDKLSIIEYMKGKSYQWGIKMFLLCGKSGLGYDFVIHQGHTTELD